MIRYSLPLITAPLPDIRCVFALFHLPYPYYYLYCEILQLCLLILLLLFLMTSCSFPDDILHFYRSLFPENFNLWLFLAQNDLVEDAKNLLALDTIHEDYSNELPFWL